MCCCQKNNVEKLCTEYEERYVIMALVLDAIKMKMDQQYGQDKFIFEIGINQKDLVLLIQNHPQLRFFGKLPLPRIYNVIQEMEDLSLITHNVLSSQESPYYLTDEGREAYEKQTYHVIASNLMEAKESRHLSTVAIIIAIISIFIAMVIGILQLRSQNIL